MISTIKAKHKKKTNLKDNENTNTPSQKPKFIVDNEPFNDSDFEENDSEGNDLLENVTRGIKLDGAFTMPPLNTSPRIEPGPLRLKYKIGEELPPHRTAYCETNITHTAIPLLQEITFLVPLPLASYVSSSSVSSQDSTLSKPLYQTIITPENRGFVFHDGTSNKNLWEARGDGAVLKRKIPNEPKLEPKSSPGIEIAGTKISQLESVSADGITATKSSNPEPGTGDPISSKNPKPSSKAVDQISKPNNSQPEITLIDLDKETYKKNRKISFGLACLYGLTASCSLACLYSPNPS